MLREGISGVYFICNVLDGKLYVGSSVNIRVRWYKHKALLRSNKHVNKKLQNAWNKYGEDNFEFSIVQTCEEESLTKVENYWISHTNSFNHGYNLIEDAERRVGFRHTEESKNKISEAMKGRVLSEVTRKKMSDRMKNSSPSDDTRLKISLAVKAAVKRNGEWAGTKNLDRTGTKQTTDQIKKRVEATKITKEINKLRKIQEELDDAR